MRVWANFITSAFGFCAFICGICANAQAQQANVPTFNETYQSAFAKAHLACDALWSDRAFDPLRRRIPLGDEKPTFSMLTNTQKLQPKEKPLADLAIKTLEKCRSGYAPVFAMLPPQVNAMIQGVQRRQDDLVAQLYNGKITFGDFNVGMNDLNGKLSEAFSGVPTQAKSASTAHQTTPVAVAQTNAPPPAALVARFNGTRLALVLGNSNYANLPKLSNPANDARSVAEILQKMGYETHLLLDGSDQSIRGEIRKFASESNKADVAVVYYAGHGAQLNGSNYLLPIDIDIPRTEADIQFAGLKLDDLVNSIGANTKIVFLDACRDNPALFKNIIMGRGSGPIGLAPATASNFNQAKPGGGVFIAYATDAGAVADDGRGRHSPFTQALLRYIQKPISIDDMFSLITREVRLVTKNAQRPYKYASLENIICLTPVCSDALIPEPTDIIQQAKQSETDDLKIALQNNSVDALEGYLEKYPDTSRRLELLNRITSAKRSELTEWTLYDIVNFHFPQFIQLSSVRSFGSRATAKVKQLIDQSKPETITGKAVPDAEYTEDMDVYDCREPIMAVAEESVFSASGELLSHYKWADPQYLNLAIGSALPAGAAGLTARYIACHEDAAAPLVSKKQISEMKFLSLSSTISGDGDILYQLVKTGQDSENQRQVIIIVRNYADHNVAFPTGVAIPDTPSYREEVDHVLLKCNENKFAIDKSEYWSASNKLVYLAVRDPATLTVSDFLELSPFKTLQMIVCGTGYAGLGLRFEQSDGAIKVAEVFENSPAQMAGIKTNDTVTHVDNEPVGGMTLNELIEKVRGPADTKVVLTILRGGQTGPLEVTARRGKIQIQSTQQGVSK
jgi:hypothetical protein